MKFGAFLHGNGDIDPFSLDVDFGFTDLGLNIAVVVIKSRDFLQVPFQDVPAHFAGAGDPGDGGKKSPLLGFHHLPEFFGAKGLVALEFNLLDGHFAAFIDVEHQVDFVFPRRHQVIGDLGLVIPFFPVGLLDFIDIFLDGAFRGHGERFEVHDLEDFILLQFIVAFHHDLADGGFFLHQYGQDSPFRGFADIHADVGEIAHLIDGFQILPQVGRRQDFPFPGLHHSQDGILLDAAVALDHDMGHPFFAQDLQAQFLGHLTTEAGEGVEPRPLEFQRRGPFAAAEVQDVAFQGEEVSHLEQGAPDDHIGSQFPADCLGLGFIHGAGQLGEFLLQVFLGNRA